MIIFTVLIFMWLHKHKWKTWSEFHALNAVSVKRHSLTSQVNNDVSRSRPQCLKDSTWYLTESLPCKSKRPSLSEPIHFRTGVLGTPFGEIHTFCLSLTSKLLDLKLVSESELKMQEPLNSCQTTRRPKGTRFSDRKTNLMKFYSWKMTATKFSDYERHTLWAQVVTPKTSVSCLERQFTSSRLNFLWNVPKVKTFLLFKQTKLKSLCSVQEDEAAGFLNEGC